MKKQSQIISGVIGLIIATVAHAGEAWNYKKKTDQMIGKDWLSAIATSINSLDLEFPYGGENRADLVVRQHPKYGQDVIFSVEKGQLMCRLNGCTVDVRFDDQQPIVFSAVNGADHDPRVIFITSAARFIAQAKKARTIKIQVVMWHAGAQVLIFKTDNPLVWPPKL